MLGIAVEPRSGLAWEAARVCTEKWRKKVVKTGNVQDRTHGLQSATHAASPQAWETDLAIRVGHVGHSVEPCNAIAHIPVSTGAKTGFDEFFGDLESTCNVLHDQLFKGTWHMECATQLRNRMAWLQD